MEIKRTHLSHCDECQAEILGGVLCLTCAKKYNVCHMCGTPMEQAPNPKAQTCDKACYQSNWRLVKKAEQLRESNEKAALQAQLTKLKDDRIDQLTGVVVKQAEIIEVQRATIDQQKSTIEELQSTVKLQGVQIASLESQVNSFLAATMRHGPPGPVPSPTDGAPSPDLLVTKKAASKGKTGRILTLQVQLTINAKNISLFDDDDLELVTGHPAFPQALVESEKARRAGQAAKLSQAKAPAPTTGKLIAGAGIALPPPDVDDLLAL